MKRNLDGVYFRIQRDGKWDDICYSDLTKEEMDIVLEGKDEKWVNSLIDILQDSLKNALNYVKENILPEYEEIQMYKNCALSLDAAWTQLLELSSGTSLHEIKNYCKMLGLAIHSVGDFYDIGCE